MKIALIGYGKMGHMIEQIAISRGHEIVSIIDIDNQQDFESEAFASADVAIEFTAPHVAYANYLKAWKAGVKVVSGSTGWLKDHGDDVRKACQEEGKTLFWASNFSIGVALFRAIAAKAEALIAPYSQYHPEITEVHHIHKLDHPSGTAVTTAETLIGASQGRLNAWTEDPDAAKADPTRLLINHRREGEVPGTHTIVWSSPVDEITIEHKAYSREGFALGAVIAAEWMAANHPRGLSSMPSLLGF